MLERNTNGQSTARRMGLFSLALIMCICCVSQLDTSVTSQGGDSRRLSQDSTSSGTTVVAALAETVHVTTPAVQSFFTDYLSQSLIQQAKWYILLLMILISFTCAVVVFPSEQLVQWAARKPLLRKIFYLKDVPIAAQTKFLKTEEKLY